MSPMRITFTAPLPPPELRLNHRTQHWAARSAAADEYSAEVTDACLKTCGNWLIHRMKAASITYTWRYAGARPDIDNIAASVKVLQDSLCSAPPPHRRAKNRRNRWYLGLIEDDGAIEPVTFRREKVARKADEGIVVEIEQLADGGST